MRSLSQIEPEGRLVFCRLDLNVPIEGGEVLNDARLLLALPTIEYLRSRGARLILASHLGRPKGQVVDSLRLAPIARELAALLGHPVRQCASVTGPEVDQAKRELAPGELLLLENLRFEPGEKAGDAAFAAQLAEGVELYVNEAFSCCHRSDASIVGLPRLLRSHAGIELQKELDSFGELLASPRQPFVLITGGAKVSDKIPLLENLQGLVQRVVIGGAMAYTFMRAEGQPIGASLVELPLVETAAQYLETARRKDIEVILPIDHIVAREASPDAERKQAREIPDGWMGLDVGPQTIALIEQALADAGTVFWNGPLGLFEMAPFSKGTQAVCRALASAEATSVIGGGDTVRAVTESGFADQISHITTGGGASLALLSGEQLPGVVALQESAD